MTSPRAAGVPRAYFAARSIDDVEVALAAVGGLISPRVSCARTPRPPATGSDSGSGRAAGEDPRAASRERGLHHRRPGSSARGQGRRGDPARTARGRARRRHADARPGRRAPHRGRWSITSRRMLATEQEPRGWRSPCSARPIRGSAASSRRWRWIAPRTIASTRPRSSHGRRRPSPTRRARRPASMSRISRPTSRRSSSTPTPMRGSARQGAARRLARQLVRVLGACTRHIAGSTATSRCSTTATNHREDGIAQLRGACAIRSARARADTERVLRARRASLAALLGEDGSLRRRDDRGDGRRRHLRACAAGHAP